MATCGRSRIMAPVQGVTSSQADPRLHFGLGETAETVDVEEIRFPDGVVEKLDNVKANQDVES